MNTCCVYVLLENSASSSPSMENMFFWADTAAHHPSVATLKPIFIFIDSKNATLDTDALMGCINVNINIKELHHRNLEHKNQSLNQKTNKKKQSKKLFFKVLRSQVIKVQTRNLKWTLKLIYRSEMNSSQIYSNNRNKKYKKMNTQH